MTGGGGEAAVMPFVDIRKTRRGFQEAKRGSNRKSQSCDVVPSLMAQRRSGMPGDTGRADTTETRCTGGPRIRSTLLLMWPILLLMSDSPADSEPLTAISRVATGTLPRNKWEAIEGGWQNDSERLLSIITVVEVGRTGEDRRLGPRKGWGGADLPPRLTVHFVPARPISSPPTPPLYSPAPANPPHPRRYRR